MGTDMRSSMTPKERIYATLKRQPVDRPAVTPIFMSWAANFAGHNYRDYYLNWRALIESQLGVVEAFNLDQISAISDPWREASAYGMQLDYPPDGVGKPRGWILSGPTDIARLRQTDILSAPRILDRIEGVRFMAAEVGMTHSVLGWIEGPMAEYSDLRGVETTLMDLFDKPEMFLEAGEILVDKAIAFAREQIKAGADMIGIGDAAASLIGPDLYSQFVLPLETKLISGIHNAGATVKLHICGNVTPTIVHMAKTGADIIDCDWMVALDKARADVGPAITLCGNFDPSAVLVQGSPQTVAAAARNCFRKAGDPFILMPGCEVSPLTPQANIRAFCPCQGCQIPDILKC